MGKQWKQWQTFFTFLGSKITADGDCSHEIKRHLLLGRKIMTNLDSILKSRDITLSLLFYLWNKVSSSEVKSLSPVRLFATPWTVAHQAPLSMGFSKQEYWSGLPFPSPITNLDSILKSRDITLPTQPGMLRSIGSQRVTELNKKISVPQLLNTCFVQTP